MSLCVSVGESSNKYYVAATVILSCAVKWKVVVAVVVVSCSVFVKSVLNLPQEKHHLMHISTKHASCCKQPQSIHSVMFV